MTIAKYNPETHPMDYTGKHLNLQISADGRVWMCLDGNSIVRVRGVDNFTIQDDRLKGKKCQANSQSA